MDYDPWAPSSILDEFRPYFEEDLCSFISNLPGPDNEVRITEIEQPQDHTTVCSRIQPAMDQLDKDTEPIDFSVDNVPDLSMSRSGLEEENEQTVNPADLTKFEGRIWFMSLGYSKANRT